MAWVTKWPLEETQQVSGVYKKTGQSTQAAFHDSQQQQTPMGSAARQQEAVQDLHRVWHVAHPKCFSFIVQT